MATQKVYHMHVEMCCQTCVDNVEEVLHETHGVASFVIERYNSLVVVKRKPNAPLDKKQLVRRFKSVTHDKKASIIKKTIEPVKKEKEKGEDTKGNTPGGKTAQTTTVYVGAAAMGPGFRPGSASAPGVITNPFYFQHPVRCHCCYGHSDIICATCGRGSYY